MNNIEQYDEQIEKFLRGEMTANEEMSFKKEVKENPELKARAEAISSLVRGMKRHGRAKDQQIISQTAKTKSRVISMRLVTWACSVAAVLAIIVSVTMRFLSVDSSKYGDIVAPYYTAYNVAMQTRGEEDTVVVAKLTKLFNGIGQSEDCSEIIKELEPIYQTLDTDITYRDYSADIEWYLSLAYIKNGQKDKAKTTLNKLIDENPDTELAEKAKKLLEEIKKVE